MPSIFEVCGYKIYFWSNENNEPIHVHISKGKPSANSTKIWLTKSGGCIVGFDPVFFLLPLLRKSRKYYIIVHQEKEKKSISLIKLCALKGE